MLHQIISFIVSLIIVSIIFFPIVLWTEGIEGNEDWPEWAAYAAVFSYLGLIFIFHKIGLTLLDKKKNK